jgi:hypothetical protein
METKPTCEDVTIPETVVKVGGCLLPAVSAPAKRDKYDKELIFDQKLQKIGSNLLALLRRISALTKLFSAKKTQKTISNLLKMN